MSDNDHPILKLLLAFFLLIVSCAIIYEINATIGAYLTAPLWLLIVAVIGIFDIAVYVKIFH
jgi:hypothetical protein